MGWRLWHVDDDRLLSWTRGAAWPAGERMEARCRRLFGHAPHEAPQSRHSCGIYALRTREQAAALLHELPRRLRKPIALGRVSLWGRVIENVGGWRAQYAYPYELFLVGGDDAVAAGLRRRYAVDVARL